MRKKEKEIELRWHVICQIALLLGVVPNLSKGPMKKLNAWLNKQPKVKRLGRGRYSITKST
ncbi:hypothetical protein [Rhodoblastus sp.]|uniref:hypothetical protein n=1 Tax=Rhodoblastus sp. TaxID=1962975 RepID=UPI003F9D419E